ncbi:AAA ATPase domain-containing protein [Streptomyces sp. Ag82_O1-12]|uniref:AAA family ATPase n=1 Tax=unclassified Streptomyces TaxID=2593676 RepID=UPI000BD1B71E|nr:MULTISPECIES: AAA family ATPase [unclassified Streptomyces]SMQ17883.1 AAA ATPase domain-containing protein [Streptomyces sp. Ag82_O1-12]SOD46921.1 AAA ATPase domain-containing protein [Streptomyces sp. Ag82_G6-1]
MRTGFVDRVEHMDELRSLLADVTEGRGGRAMVVDSVSGMGKSALLQAFESETAASHGPGLCRVVSVRCQPSIGSALHYGTIVELLLQLARDQEVKQPGVFRRLLSFTGQGVVRSAPEVLSAIVPGLGALFTLGKEVAETSLASGSMPFDSLLPFQQGAAAQIVDALLDLVRQGPPTVVLIDDIQHGDPSSLLVLDRLLRRLPGEPLGLVLSHTTDGAYVDGPESMVEDLLHDWAKDGLLRRRVLGGLPHDAVAELVRYRRPDAPPTLSEQLSRLTAGHAVFVTLCLEEWRPDTGPTVELPSSLSRVVEERLRLLTELDRELLMIGATHGETFLSRTVAEVKGAPHDEVMERLRLIAAQHRFILPTQPPGWARLDASDCYRFEHSALWGVVYDQQTPQQMRSRHARIAAALTTGPLDGMPLERRLEIARHLRNGGTECLLVSAEVHYGLARDAAMEGLSFAEAERHCEEVIKAVRDLPQQEESRDQWLVQAVELLLSLTEVRWRGQHQSAGGPDIDALAAEAEAAARRCCSPELAIRTTLLRGKTLLATQGLVPSLDKLRAAVELAEQHGDPVPLFVARVEYGRQVSKRRLADGLAQLQEAERMYASDPRLGGTTDPVLQHARNLGEMQLGITLYDSGHLSEAQARLSRCVQRLRDEPLKAELPIALNYLAQVHMGLGAYEDAEEVLGEALAFEADRGGDSGWHAYNKALLAHLLIQQRAKRAQALELIADAWAETERTWLANLVPIVRNLYAEILLLAADAPGELLDQADRLAVATCVETQRSGMIRSEIAAHSLRSRILLRGGDTVGAQEQARQAVRILDEVGDMPALRTEEVLYHSGVVLAAGGVREEASVLLQRARREVDRKAEQVTDDLSRDRFLTRVPLNNAILHGEGAAQ